MNEVLQAMLERRSCRNYRTEMPPKETLEAVIQAGLYAASGRGRQGAIVVAVTDRAARDRLMEANAAVMGQPDMDPFYGAPAVLVVLADRSVPTGVYDASLVMGNLMLAAHALGLGSCWIHRAKEEFETEEWKAFLRSLGVEGDYEGVGHCVLGYPAGALPEPPARKPGRVFWVE